MSDETFRDIALPYPFDPPSVGEAFDAGLIAGGDNTRAGASPFDPSREPSEDRAWHHGYEVGRARAV